MSTLSIFIFLFPAIHNTNRYIISNQRTDSILLLNMDTCFLKKRISVANSEFDGSQFQTYLHSLLDRFHHLDLPLEISSNKELHKEEKV